MAHLTLVPCPHLVPMPGDSAEVVSLKQKIQAQGGIWIDMPHARRVAREKLIELGHAIIEEDDGEVA